MDISITRNQSPKAKPTDASQLGFGKVFTDHMFLMDYDRANGWHDARIVPYGDISISPASTVLHYGAEVFEGLKAYRRPDGEIQLFRPRDNFARMNDSAERLCLPELDGEFCLKALCLPMAGSPAPGRNTRSSPGICTMRASRSTISGKRA